jgi:CheY-like chemotaxis protein
MKVLLIEDNPVDLKLMSALLMMDGHETYERPSTEGALELIRDCRPHVILLDLNLAGVEGLALVRELRQHRDVWQIPIVAVTAYPLRYQVTDVLAAGCSRCIIKPIDTRELVNQLCAVAGHGAPGRVP